MTWEDVLLETAADLDALPDAVDRLFARSQASWPLWREGHEALAGVHQKTLGSGAERIIVQHNPARRRSVHAVVDPAAIAARPCFLCPGSFPEGETGVAWRDLALLPNPFPIVARHLTIPTLEHQPQALAGRAQELVELAQALGESMVVLYNGPRCGASAPDHFHFQAGAADTLPALEVAAAHAHDGALAGITSVGRRFAVLYDTDAAALGERIEYALGAWGRVHAHSEGEPMCNVVVHWQGSRGRALFFPRRAHRPYAFFAEPSERIGVSPAALEMAGILVVSDHDSFERLDDRAARTVYADVSPTAPEFVAFMEKVR